VLQGHVDVVPIGDPDQWVDDPFAGVIRDGVLFGRGACDMKAGLAANIEVAAALQRSGVRLARPLSLHAVVSEEDGGLGAFATLDRGHRGDAAVITEPTSGRVVVANAGALTFEIRVPGQAAHGSMRREGISAFEAFLPIHTALRDLEERRNRYPHPLFGDSKLPYPVSIGRVSAGDWASSVPDLLVAQGRCGVALGEDPEHAQADFEAAVHDASVRDPWLRDHPPVVTWWGGQYASGAIAEGHPLIDATQRAVADVAGWTPPVAAAPYGSDLRLYTGVGGIPTLHYGPGDVRYAHGPHEQVRLDEVVQCARALALLAVRYCC
jgi:acetylornithine deacetylase